MWRQFTQRHCTDEELLSHLDGELSVLRETSVRRHLYLCWECRKHLHDLDEQTRVVSQALGEDSFTGCDRTERAQSRFLVWQQQFERKLVPAPRLSLPEHSTQGRAAGLVFATLALISIGVAGWLQSRQLDPRPPELIVRTATAERALFESRSVVRQTFRVRIRQTAPDVYESVGEIEVWSDAAGSRYASRWRDSDGQLLHAVWRPGNGEHLIYNPTVAPKVRTAQLALHPPDGIRSLADWSQFSMNVGQLESGVMRWLETRQWQPVTFGSRFEAFARDDGATLRGERIATGLCLEAERVFGDLRMQVTLELNEDSDMPRLQRIRFETKDRVMEVELTADRCEFVSAATAIPTVFEPARTLARELPLSPPQQAVGAPRPGEQSSLSPASLAAIEMEVHYALHGARSCLGEPVRVIRRAGAIVIEGVTETEERKEELRLALAGISGIQISIQSVGEALAQVASQKSSAEAMEETTSAPTVWSARARLPIHEQLARFFADHPDGNPDTAPKIARFATQAVSISQAALSHAWALRRLAERHGDEQEADLTPRSLWLLRVMVRDHLVALDSDSKQVRVFLDPLLTETTNAQFVPRPLLPSTGGPLNADWNQECLTLFKLTSQVDTLIRALLAGAELPGPSDSPLADSDARLEAIERVRQLAATLLQLDLEFGRLASPGISATYTERDSL